MTDDFNVVKDIQITSEKLTEKMIDAAFLAASEVADSVGIKHKQSGHTFSIYVPVNNNPMYDMKPAFEHSSKVQYTKEGSWYLIVPIARQTSSMSSQLQKNVEKAFSGALNFSTQYIDSLVSQRSQIGLPVITKQSGNLTKMKDNLGRTNYMAFRTVSAKSPIDSWIIGRNQLNDQKTDAIIDSIEDVIRQVVGA